MEVGQVFYNEPLMCSHCKGDRLSYILQPCKHALCKSCWIRIKADLAKDAGFLSKCPIDKTPLPMAQLSILDKTVFNSSTILKLGRGKKNAKVTKNEVPCPKCLKAADLDEGMGGPHARCKPCDYIFCFECSKAYHGVSECDVMSGPGCSPASTGDKILQVSKQMKSCTVEETKTPLPSAPAVNDVLECTICLDPAVSPINQCDNGHIVCGFCSDKMEQCGLCKTKLQISVLAERQSRQFDLKCNCLNFESGCVAPLAATEAKDHVAKCYYRDVICEVTDEQECDKVQILLKNFPEHLQTIHDIEVIGHDTNVYKDFTFPVIGNNFAFPGSNLIHVMLKKHDQTFLLHSYMETKSVHFWATVLGDDKAAEKYLCYLNIRNTNSTRRQMDLAYKMPVLPYHDHSKFDGEKMHDNCVNITPSVVAQFGVRKETDKPYNRFVLETTFGII